MKNKKQKPNTFINSRTINEKNGSGGGPRETKEEREGKIERERQRKRDIQRKKKQL